MPIKLFEYISYGLPILSTSCMEIIKYINKKNLSLVVNHDVPPFVKGIEEMIKNLGIIRGI